MSNTPPALRQTLRYGALTGVVLVTAAVAWTLGPGAGWVLRHVDGVHGLKGKDLADALDAVRGRALAIATGLAALVAVYYTARNAETARRTLQHGVESASRTAELTEQGQVTERYTKAIEQLGNKDSRDIRIGGIYALERIATDSARDHPTVMEVLTAFVRERCGEDDSAEDDSAEASPHTSYGSPSDGDIKAALTVIGRRIPTQDTRRIDLSWTFLECADLSHANLAGAIFQMTDLTDADLSEADLAGAELSTAHLNTASLYGADLTGAELVSSELAGADLTGADLTDANLRNAQLSRADLSRVSLVGADLTYAQLAEADLTGADLTGANLTGAGLIGANLTGADLRDSDLTRADLTEAKLTDLSFNAGTKWPKGYSPLQ